MRTPGPRGLTTKQARCLRPDTCGPASPPLPCCRLAGDVRRCCLSWPTPSSGAISRRGWSLDWRVQWRVTLVGCEAENGPDGSRGDRHDLTRPAHIVMNPAFPGPVPMLCSRRGEVNPVWVGG